QALSLGVDALAPRFDRERTAAADGDIQVQPVLDCLWFGYYLEPDAWAAAGGIDDAVLADPQVILAHADVTAVVVPGREALWWWLEVVSQGRGPETRERFRISAVNDDLEADSHQVLPRGAVRAPDSVHGHPTLTRRSGVVPQREQTLLTTLLP